MYDGWRVCAWVWGGVCTVSASWHTLFGCWFAWIRAASGLISAWLGHDVKQLAQVHGGHPHWSPQLYPTLWMQQRSMFIPQIASMLSWEDWRFSFWSIWLSVGLKAELLKSPLVRTETAAGAVYWQHDHTVSLMWLSLSHCVDCSCKMSRASHSALIKRH